jgi:hypothetical protein
MNFTFEQIITIMTTIGTIITMVIGSVYAGKKLNNIHTVVNSNLQQKEKDLKALQQAKDDALRELGVAYEARLKESREMILDLTRTIAYQDSILKKLDNGV